MKNTARKNWTAERRSGFLLGALAALLLALPSNHYAQSLLTTQGAPGNLGDADL